MKHFIVTLLLILAATFVQAQTEVIIGIKDQHVDTTDVCLEHVKAVATVSAQYWDTIRLDADQIEMFLPSVNTPCAYQSDPGVFWIRAKMPDNYADSLQQLLLLKFDEYAGLLHQVIVMRPDAEGDLPEEPVWHEPIKDEAGNIIGTATVMVGRIQ